MEWRAESKKNSYKLEKQNVFLTAWNGKNIGRNNFVFNSEELKSVPNFKLIFKGTFGKYEKTYLIRHKEGLTGRQLQRNLTLHEDDISLPN